MKNLYFLLLSTLLFSSLARTKTLSLSEGVISAGGSAYMLIAKPQGSSAALGFIVEPEAEYFISRSLALGSTVKFSTVSFFSDHSLWEYGLGLSLKYHFLLSSAVHPYIGIGGDVGWQTGNRPISLSFKLPLGLLVPLNNRVALNIGAPPTFLFSQDGYRGMTIPVGYLGIKAYF